ncbi:MAG: DUF1778 domain-containing protein [Porticoccaceae bacterium]
MTTTANKESAGRRINLRVSEELCELIDAGARASHKDRTAFMLEAAREKALAALLDQRIFELSDEGYRQVRDIFEQRLSDNPRSAELMARRPQWKPEPRDR